ncbi:MAG: PQQ-binding-like beta-propeller repeat protein [Rhizomicrobium sp.]
MIVPCVGNAYYTHDLNCNFSVHANALQSGAVAWTYKTPGLAYKAASGDDKIFAVGSGAEKSGVSDFRVVALDQKTGSVIWNSKYVPAGSLGGVALNVAVQGNVVVAVGDVFTGASQKSYTLVRAYDADTGKVV